MARFSRCCINPERFGFRLEYTSIHPPCTIGFLYTTILSIGPYGLSRRQFMPSFDEIDLNRTLNKLNIRVLMLKFKFPSARTGSTRQKPFRSYFMWSVIGFPVAPFG